MGLSVFYPEDIRNALLAAEQAANATAKALGDVAGDHYLTGYRSALTTLALAFGLVRPGTGSEVGELDKPMKVW